MGLKVSFREGEKLKHWPAKQSTSVARQQVSLQIQPLVILNTFRIGKFLKQLIPSRPRTHLQPETKDDLPTAVRTEVLVFTAIVTPTRRDCVRGSTHSQTQKHQGQKQLWLAPLGNTA